MAGAFWQCSGGADTVVTGSLAGLGVGGWAHPDDEYGCWISRPGTIDLLTYQIVGNARTTITGLTLVGHSGGEPGTRFIAPGEIGNKTVDGAFTVAESDSIFGSMTPNFESGDPIDWTSISFRFTAADPTITCSRFTACGSIPIAAGESFYVALVGSLNGSATEALVTFRPGAGATAGTMHYASIFIHANTLNADATVLIRVAGSDTPIAVTIPAGLTGWFHHTISTAAVAALESANWLVDATAATTGSITIRAMQVDFLTTNGIWTSGLGQQGRTIVGDKDLNIGGDNQMGGPQLFPQGGSILAMGLYVSQHLSGQDNSLTWVSDGLESNLAVPIPANETGIFQAGGFARNAANADALIRFAFVGTSITYECIWFAGQAPSLDGAIGPYVWVHEARNVFGETAIETSSDHDMACPRDWENGFKEARILSWGTAERRLSHPWTGEWTGSQFQYTKSDYDRRDRVQIQNENRYWGLRVVKMTDRATRAQLRDPYTIFVGPMVDAQPASPLTWEVTLSDRVTQALITDNHQIPWRYARDGIIGHLDTVSTTFDLETPEPIIYGDHRRIPDVDVASPQGFLFAPIYIGIKSSKHQFVVAGHACKSIPDIYLDDGTSVTSITADIGSGWTVPGHGGELLYVDYTSATYPGTTRRYSVIQGDVGNADADACAAGEKTLLCAIQGIEDVGDGSGDCITDRLLQYKHFVINFIVNFGPDSYQSGNWLATPYWDVFGIPVPMVDTASFDLASSIASTRYPIRLPRPGGGTYSEGYIGAAIIGAKAGDRASVKRWIAEWNRSCGVQCGFTRIGEYRITMLHPTQADKDAAPLFTDATEIIAGTFATSIGWSDQANAVPWRNDYEARTGIWKTTGLEQDTTAITNYGREIRSEQKEYPFAPGITMGTELARRELAQRTHPPRSVMISASVGPDPDATVLAHLDLGDWAKYRHFASVGSSASQERLGQIVRHQVQPGKRYVLAEVLDCEDFIGFDAAQTLPEPSPTNTGCAGAIDVTPAALPMTPYIVTVNTVLDPTDTSVAGLLPGSPTPTAYCARWFKITAPEDGHLFVTTYSSDYDTQIAYFTGSCGSLSLMADGYNNDDTVLNATSSVLDLAVTSGTTVYILAAAFTPTGGNLTIGINFYVPE